MAFKVLIIDDSQSIQKIVAACVKSLGAEVAGLGGDGEIGFELFKKTKLHIFFPWRKPGAFLFYRIKFKKKRNFV